MKHGTKPTVAQRKLMAERGLDWTEWLVERELLDRLELMHRHHRETKRTILK